MCLVFLFFFQAEDGIRDRDVTGVQTCALPILKPRSVIGLAECGVQVTDRGFIKVDQNLQTSAPGYYAIGDVAGPRSEERRVGKECRSGWSPAPSTKRDKGYVKRFEHYGKQLKL